MQSPKKLSNRSAGILCLVAIFVVVGVLSGTTGIRLVAGMLLLYFVPAYLILRNFELDTMEKTFFSFFIGFGLFPITTLYLSKVVGSLKLGVLTTFAVAVCAGLLTTFFKQKK